MDKVNRINKELLRKTKAVQSQGRFLAEEKADLLSQLLDRDNLVDELKLLLTEAEKAKRDLEQTKVGS